MLDSTLYVVKWWTSSSPAAAPAADADDDDDASDKSYVFLLALLTYSHTSVTTVQVQTFSNEITVIEWP